MKFSKSYEFKPFFHENHFCTYVKIIFFTSKFDKILPIKKKSPSYYHPIIHPSLLGDGILIQKPTFH
jgi:hypothetical protein